MWRPVHAGGRFHIAKNDIAL